MPPTTEDEVVLWPLVMPIDELVKGNNVSTDGTSVTVGPVTSTANLGHIIRVWYKNNKTDLGAVVTLQKKALLGYNDVMTFTVGSGEGKWKEYSGNSGAQQYRIIIAGDGGAGVKGYIRCVQTNTSLNS